MPRSIGPRGAHSPRVAPSRRRLPGAGTRAYAAPGRRDGDGDGDADAVPASVEKAYRIALGRRPDDSERQRMSDFIKSAADQAKGPKALETATADFCHVLLCLNEFIYID